MPTLKRKRVPWGTYLCWLNMVARCTHKNHPAYKHYGGRGITVCERWRKYEAFLADMGARPKGLTLERNDNERLRTGQLPLGDVG